MNFNIEKEYKCLVSKEQFETLLKYYPGVSFQTPILIQRILRSSS